VTISRSRCASCAAGAAISEALLFKHFPRKAALYAEILAEECEADPDLAHLLGQELSTAALVELTRNMARYFLQIGNGPDELPPTSIAAKVTCYA
jgi:AcrR family transcriptional regulator